MQIQKINNISFKQINLSPEEFEQGEKAFEKLQTTTFENAGKINKEIFDIFQPHLDNEVDLKNCPNSASKVDFAKTFFLKFHESLKNFKYVVNGFEKFISDLNSFSENYQILNPEIKENSEEITKYNVSTAERNLYITSRMLGITKDRLLELAKENPAILSVKPNIIMNNISVVADELNLDKEAYKQSVSRNAYALTIKPEKVIENVKNLSGVLGIAKEEAANLLLKNSNLISTSADKVDSNITKTAKMLNIEKEKSEDQ